MNRIVVRYFSLNIVETIRYLAGCCRDIAVVTRPFGTTFSIDRKSNVLPLYLFSR